MPYEVLPILVRGRQCNVSDVVMEGIWRQIVSEGRAASLFFSGEVTTAAQWKQVLTTPSHVGAIAIDAERGEFRHVAWLNGVVGHRATLHHVAMGRFSRGAARAIMRYWQTLRTARGEPAIQLLLGVTPESNLPARRLIRVMGFTESGTVPLMCFNASAGTYEAGVTSYCLLQGLALGRDRTLTSMRCLEVAR